MRIVIDLDGTICSLKRTSESYSDVMPLPGAVEKIESLRKAGHYIIIQTARHMKTTGSNLGQVLAKQGKVTIDWLEKHNITYDEIYFGKPYGDIYIDDNSFLFYKWDELPSSFFETFNPISLEYTLLNEQQFLNPFEPELNDCYKTLNSIIITPVGQRIQEYELEIIKKDKPHGAFFTNSKTAELFTVFDKNNYVINMNEINFEEALNSNTIKFYYHRSLELFSKNKTSSSNNLLKLYYDLLLNGKPIKIYIK